MKELCGGAVAIMLLGFSSCSSPASGPDGATDVVDGDFPEAQAVIKATRAACTEAAMNRDWNALRSFHLESPKFSKITNKGVRYDFDQMIAEEIAGVSSMLDVLPDLEVDLRDQKIDVFGDTAVETAFLEATGTMPNGDRMGFEVGVSAVWVLTDAGWKIAHEQGTPANDIVSNRFAMDQAAIRAEMEALDDAVNRGDWDDLRSAHLPGPKFSKLRLGSGRQNFDEMIAEETANLSATHDFSIDWRDLRIDVFGDVAVATALPVYSWNQANGESTAIEALATMVWVKTAEGWKIAHEHNTRMDAE